MFVTLCLPVRRVGATGNDLPPTSSSFTCAIGPAVKINTWVWSSVNGTRSTSNCAST
jgi:hypothetical protein